MDGTATENLCPHAPMPQSPRNESLYFHPVPSRFYQPRETLFILFILPLVIANFPHQLTIKIIKVTLINWLVVKITIIDQLVVKITLINIMGDKLLPNFGEKFQR